MITRSFLHIPGIGQHTERKFWRAGIMSWDDFTPGCAGIGDHLSNKVLNYLNQSRKAFAKEDLSWFLGQLPTSEAWRVLNYCPETTVYLDIETTGLWRGTDKITTVALFDGRLLKTYVRGKNLHDLESDLKKYQLIVTYNGKCFDLPFIEDDLNFSIPAPDVDLRFLCASLGWRGGLKQIESDLGLKRPRVLSLLTGFDAPILWKKHLKGHPTALSTLLAYNCADVVSLQTIAQMLFNAKLSPKFRKLQMSVNSPDYSFSHKPDPSLIKQLQKEFYAFTF